MYHHFYGLRELPFELTPNPKFVYLPARHREALSNLEYGLCSAKALTLLIGEAGTGKTTLLRTVQESEPCRRVRWVYLNNPALTRDEFVEWLAARFELSAEARRSKTVCLEELEQLLHERRRLGEIVALVVDEAQSLSLELLEEIRLLANIETATEKLLPLVLAGQPELAARLNRSELRQLKQRVALRCEILPFSLSETAGYIASRIRSAGGDAARLFTREAVTMIHGRSRGIPRTISVICDNALLSGFAAGRRSVDSELVGEVCRDFDLAQAASSADGDVRLAPTMADVEAESEPSPGTENMVAEPQNEPALPEEIDALRPLRLFGFARR